MDVCFLLDTSGSIIQNDPQRTNWNLVLNFTQRIVQTLDIPKMKIGVGLIYYGNSAYLHFNLNYSIPSVLQMIGKTPFLNENTNTSGAIWLMRSQVFPCEETKRCPDTYRVGMVITDGASTYDPERVAPEATAAKDCGVRMFAIGVGSNIKDSELAEIASKPTSRHKFMVNDFVDLSTLILDLLKTKNNTEPETTTTTTTTTTTSTTTAKPSEYYALYIVSAVPICMNIFTHRKN